MRKIIAVLFAGFTLFSLHAQNDSIPLPEEIDKIETPEKTQVSFGSNEVLIIEENGDTTRVKLGKKGLSIVESDDGTSINVIEMDTLINKEEEKEIVKRKKQSKFKPHFAGIELGLNNYVNPDFSFTLPNDQRYMDLNTGKSWNFNINFIEYGLPLGTRYAGIVTGMGFEWNNYVFDNQNSIRKDENGDIVEFVPEYASTITKSKLNTTYLTAPLLLEFQIPAGKKPVHISAGVIGGVKLHSNTKIKYTENGNKQKVKDKGDYNLSPLRYGATFRIGYRALNIYANYYLTPLFENQRGPELYPLNIGLCLIPF